jgi:predicted nucleic acid-binding protein
MPNVISNSSPIIHLTKVGRLDLLHELYDVVVVPSAVYAECLSEGKDRVEIEIIKRADWLQVAPVSNHLLVRLLMTELDDGESEVIALALERKAELVLLDDADAREKARIYALNMTGTLGVLLRAKHEGKILVFRDILDQLIQTGFRIHPRLRKRFLEEAGEV